MTLEIVGYEVIVYNAEIRIVTVFLLHFFIKMLTELDGVVVTTGIQYRIGCLPRARSELKDRFALANLCVFLMNNYSGNETVNAGTGKEVSIKELTELVAKVVGYKGEILWDTSKPNGTPRKLLDVSKAEKLGWRYQTELEDGIRLSYMDFLHNPMRAER